MAQQGLWIKVGVLALRHPKTIAAGPMAGWLWIASIGYAREQMTDGYIAKVVVPTLLPSIPAKRSYLHAAKLVEVGLYDDVVGGYQIHDYLVWNPSKAEVQEKWDSDKRRKESKRNPNGQPEDSDRTLTRAPSDSASVSPDGSAVVTSEESPRETAALVTAQEARVLSARPVGLGDKCHLHHPATWGACGRGSCVPKFIVDEWVRTCAASGWDAYDAIRRVVVAAVESVDAEHSFMPANPPNFWRSWWVQIHGGASAPAANGRATVTGHAMASARAVLRDL